MADVTGAVEKIEPQGLTMQVATVRLDGDADDRRYEVSFHADLLDQWAPDVLRAYLLQQAADARAAAVPPPPHANLEAVLGAGTASPVTRSGELGAEPPAGEPCPRDCSEAHSHWGAAGVAP